MRKSRSRINLPNASFVVSMVIVLTILSLLNILVFYNSYFDHCVDVIRAVKNRTVGNLMADSDQYADLGILSDELLTTSPENRPRVYVVEVDWFILNVNYFLYPVVPEPVSLELANQGTLIDTMNKDDYLISHQKLDLAEIDFEVVEKPVYFIYTRK